MSGMTILEWRATNKSGSPHKGFVGIELPNGLRINGISIVMGKFGPWASMPAKPIFESDGRPKIGQNGKPMYSPILQWNSRELQGRFSEKLIELLLLQHPGALDEGGAP